MSCTAGCEAETLERAGAARLTKWIKREVTRIVTWKALDENYSVGECEIKLMGWDKKRRFVVVMEQIRDSKPAVGKKLIDLPEYTFRVFVSSLPAPPEEIWRDYNQRAGMENRIAELKHDLGAGRFCLKDFCSTDAVSVSSAAPVGSHNIKSLRRCGRKSFSAEQS